MKKILFTGLCLLVFGLGFAAIIGFRVTKAQLTKQTSASVTPALSPSLSRTPTEFNLQPPRQSLTGKVINIEGFVTKLARDEEDPVKLITDAIILEGEQITSSPSSALIVQFGQKAMMSINPETIVAFPSTNPANFLTKQDKGIIVYETDEQIATISARSLHGLFTVSEGKAQLSVDPNTKLITFMMVRGQGKIGYIDTNNQTQIVELKQNDVAIFDDTKRIVAVN